MGGSDSRSSTRTEPNALAPNSGLTTAGKPTYPAAANSSSSERTRRALGVGKPSSADSSRVRTLLRAASTASGGLAGSPKRRRHARPRRCCPPRSSAPRRAARPLGRARPGPPRRPCRRPRRWAPAATLREPLDPRDSDQWPGSSSSTIRTPSSAILSYAGACPRSPRATSAIVRQPPRSCLHPGRVVDQRPARDATRAASCSPA